MCRQRLNSSERLEYGMKVLLLPHVKLMKQMVSGGMLRRRRVEVWGMVP